MNLDVGEQLNKYQLKELEFLTTNKDLNIYRLEESAIFFVAIDNTGLICACFEFHEVDDNYQLAHMNVTRNLQRRGIGKTIMKEAVEIFGIFELPVDNNNAYYPYIEYGKNFVESCFNEGILKAPFGRSN